MLGRLFSPNTTIKTIAILLALSCARSGRAADGPSARARSDRSPPSCEANLFATEALASRFDVEHGRFVITYWSRTTYPAAEFVTTVHRTYEATSTVDLAPAADVLERYYAEVAPLVALANAKFEARRAWGPEFSAKNVAVAKAYLAKSTYVTIRDHEGRLLGGIRNINARDDERIPEENFLRVKLPRMGVSSRSGGLPWKNEIGTLVVDEGAPADLRRKVILEIWAHLFRSLFSKTSVRENVYDQSFHTYGDPTSLLLYKPLGFKKLRRYEHEGREVDHSALAERDVPPILIGGEPWWPLVLLPKEAKTLNKIFSASSRARVSPEWIEARRRELADPWVSPFEFGAFFPHVLADLHSPAEATFFAALKGLEDVVKSARPHMEVAKIDLLDAVTAEAVIAELIEIRGDLLDLVVELKKHLPGMTTERRVKMTMFLGRILQMGDRAMDYLPSWSFFEDSVFELVSDANLEVSEPMIRYLMGQRTPRQWIEQTGLALDLGRYEDGPEFVKDVEEAGPRLLERLAGQGHSPATIERLVEAFRKALFTPPRMHGSVETSYLFDYADANAATVYLHLLENRDRATVKWIVQLAAVRQYLHDRDAQSRGGLRARGLSPGTTSESDSSAARARSVTRLSFFSRVRTILSTSLGR